MDLRDNYELEAQLAAGGHGRVWRGRRRGPVPQDVAVKRVPAGARPEAVRALRAEAEVLAALDHPHVVRVLDVVDDDGGVAVVMQYAPGGSLADLLAWRGPLHPGEAVAVLAPVADALASAHRRGVLHGDVKPANVLFTSDGEPVLGDFGIARRLGATTAGVAGTPEYLAPEVAAGADPDERADVYSLGVTAYEALTGSVPYDGPTPAAVLRAAAATSPPPLAGVPAPLAAEVAKAMARQPADRHPSAAQLARALRAAVPPADAVLPGPASTPSPTGTATHRPTRSWGPRPFRGRRLPRWAGVLAIGGVAAGAVALLVQPGGDHGTAGGGGGTTDPCAQPAIARPAGAVVVAGDFAGNGCTTEAVWSAGVLEVGLGDGPPRRLRLGQAGDQLLVGDWDCDDDDTPALYRPATGNVLYFDDWPDRGGTLISRDPVHTGTVGSQARVEPADRHGCDKVTVA